MLREKETNYIELIKGPLDARDSRAITRLFKGFHPTDIAGVFNAVSEEEMLFLFRLLTPDVASEVFLEVDERRRERLIAVISSNELVEVVDEMETDDAADIISELPDEDAQMVLEGLADDEALEVQKLLNYPEDTAGGKMQAELISVGENATVDEAIEEVRRNVPDVENISNVFVVNSRGELIGVAPLDKLILAPWNKKIMTVTDTEPIKAFTDLDQEEVGRLFQRYDLFTMPVVDHDNKLVGRITIDDVVDVIEEEIFEDFYRMASLNVGERPLDPPLRSFRMRAPWLLLNLVTAFLAASVVKIFEGTIETLVVLAVLMPIVAGLGGNAATQTITVVIRGIALGDVGLRNAGKVILKEASVGLANGLLIGAVGGVVAYLLGSDVMLGVLIFLAMTANLLIAGLGGATVPLILRRLNLDPALSSSIFVTAFTDIGGFFTFLGLAAVFINAGWL